MEKKIFFRRIPAAIPAYFFRVTFLLLALIWGSFLYLKGLSITGPFIFGDEFTYFSFAKSIFHHKSLASHTQYGPLFPFIISSMLGLTNMAATYQMIRLFNLVVFISASIPAFLLANDIFKNKWIKILLPLCVLITPFSGLIYLIWAEPLYIALFYWSCFILYRHIQKPTISNSLLLSIFLSSLYYTKPASGLVALIAALLTLAIHYFLEKKSPTKKASLLNGMVVLAALIFLAPWILHYHYLHVSIIGYPAVTGSFIERINHDGYQTILFEVLRGVFYQFSYFIIGSFGIMSIGIAIFVLRWKSLNSADRSLMLFTLLCVLGLTALSALGMSSMAGLDFKMPQGRYFSLLLPLLITLSLHLLFNTELKKRDVKLTLGIMFLIIGIAIIASPFYTRSPLVFNSMPEIAPYIYIIDQGHVIWRATISQPTLFLRAGMPLIFGIFTACILLFRREKYTPFIITLIIFALMLFSAFTEIYYINILGESQSGLSNVYVYLKENHIDISSVAFDKEMESGNVQFLTPFWTGKLPSYLTITEVKKNIPHITPEFFIACAKQLPFNKVFSSYGCTVYSLSKRDEKFPLP